MVVLACKKSPVNPSINQSITNDIFPSECSAYTQVCSSNQYLQVFGLDRNRMVFPTSEDVSTHCRLVTLITICWNVFITSLSSVTVDGGEEEKDEGERRKKKEIEDEKVEVQFPMCGCQCQQLVQLHA